jgi:hypothetical protein
MHCSCRKLIGRYTPDLPMIGVLQKARPISAHNIMETDSLMSFKHSE